jgi:hypothetical protein
MMMEYEVMELMFVEIEIHEQSGE